MSLLKILKGRFKVFFELVQIPHHDGYFSIGPPFQFPPSYALLLLFYPTSFFLDCYMVGSCAPCPLVRVAELTDEPFLKGDQGKSRKFLKKDV